MPKNTFNRRPFFPQVINLPGAAERALLCMMIALCTVASLAEGAPLDDFYLEKFHLAPPRKVSAADPTALPEAPDRCRTWLHHDVRRDWKLLEPQTQKTLAKVLSMRPALPGATSFLSDKRHFRINYATSGGDAPPLEDGNGNGTPDWVETVASTFEGVYAAEVTAMGYKAAPTAGGGPYDVYLQNVGSYEYGEAVTDAPVSDTSYTSYMIIDNDFSVAEFGNQISQYTPLKALQITAAHEYHHAIQYGYNFFFESWYAEASATWIEDEVYDGVNQLYLYLPNYMNSTGLSLDTPTSVSSGGGYARWIFNRHLAEQFTPAAIRDIWAELGKQPMPPDYSDIPMLPVIDTVLLGKGSSLGTEFGAFARKLYTRGWTSHVSEISQIHPVRPVTTSTTYPASGTASLPHYAFGAYGFQPSTLAPTNLAISVTKSPGLLAAGFLSTGSGATEYQPDGSGSFILPSFTDPSVQQGVLLLINATSGDGGSASFSAGEATTFPLTVTKTGTGSGSINSTPTGIACATGSNSGCSANFLTGTAVKLQATASAGSTFAGWSDSCTGTGDCTVTMDATKYVTASFTLVPPVRIAGQTPAYYPTLQEAYDAAASGAGIEMKEGVLTGTLVAGRPVNTFLRGGYDASFGAVSSHTSVDGSIVVRNGSLRVARVKVQ